MGLLPLYREETWADTKSPKWSGTLHFLQMGILNWMFQSSYSDKARSKDLCFLEAMNRKILLMPDQIPDSCTDPHLIPNSHLIKS